MTRTAYIAMYALGALVAVAVVLHLVDRVREGLERSRQATALAFVYDCRDRLDVLERKYPDEADKDALVTCVMRGVLTVADIEAAQAKRLGKRG